MYLGCDHIVDWHLGGFSSSLHSEDGTRIVAFGQNETSLHQVERGIKTDVGAICIDSWYQHLKAKDFARSWDDYMMI